MCCSHYSSNNFLFESEKDLYRKPQLAKMKWTTDNSVHRPNGYIYNKTPEPKVLSTILEEYAERL